MGWTLTAADWGHLQIVYEWDEIEVQAPNPVSIPFGGDWIIAQVRNHVNSINTPNYGDEDYYKITTVYLREGQIASEVWQLLIAIRDQFAAAAPIDYNYDQNSNSYATTLLSIVGVNIFDYLGDVFLSHLSLSDRERRSEQPCSGMLERYHKKQLFAWEMCRYDQCWKGKYSD
jgi:hypothetical protein